MLPSITKLVGVSSLRRTDLLSRFVVCCGRCSLSLSAAGNKLLTTTALLVALQGWARNFRELRPPFGKDFRFRRKTWQSGFLGICIQVSSDNTLWVHAKWRSVSGMKDMQAMLKHVDCILELHDARISFTEWDFVSWLSNKSCPFWECYPNRSLAAKGLGRLNNTGNRNSYFTVAENTCVAAVPSRITLFAP